MPFATEYSVEDDGMTIKVKKFKWNNCPIEGLPSLLGLHPKILLLYAKAFEDAHTPKQTGDGVDTLTDADLDRLFSGGG